MKRGLMRYERRTRSLSVPDSIMRKVSGPRDPFLTARMSS